MVNKLFDFLAGKKTYIVAAVLAIVNFGVAMGWISPENLEQINVILVALGLGAIRAGINKV